MAYDLNDHLIWRRDPKSAYNGGAGGARTTTYSNDDFGRNVSTTSPDIGTWISNYDPAGDLISEQDATGAQLTYSYDYAARQTALTSPTTTDSVSYVYDKYLVPLIGGVLPGFNAGRLAGVNAWAPDGGVLGTGFVYDYLGRIEEEEDIRQGAELTFAGTSYSWADGGNELLGMTYPDGLVISYGYPYNGNAFPADLPTALSASFQDGGATLVGGIYYFPDQVVAGLTYGDNSVRALTRNKSGQVTAIQSGPEFSGPPNDAGPWLNQTLTYDSYGLGELVAVDFNPGLSNAWNWTFSNDGFRRLTQYTTTVRSPAHPDSDLWTYDEVGNRTVEAYDGGTSTTYTYDSSGQTNQLLSQSGANLRTLTYDQDGDTVQDHWYGGANTWNQYGYTTRHAMQSLAYYNYGYQFTTETYLDDGLERRWQKVSHTGTWVQYYYDQWNRVIEEFQYNNVTVNGCQAYDIVDHVYLGPGANEVARVIQRLQSGSGCSTYAFVNEDVYYVHEDYRNTAFAIESREINNGDGGLAWEGETTPFGDLLHSGLPGPDGKIGTSDDTSALLTNTLGYDEQYIDTEFDNVCQPEANASYTPTLARQVQPTMSGLVSAYGVSGPMARPDERGGYGHRPQQAGTAPGAEGGNGGDYFRPSGSGAYSGEQDGDGPTQSNASSGGGSTGGISGQGGLPCWGCGDSYWQQGGYTNLGGYWGVTTYTGSTPSDDPNTPPTENYRGDYTYLLGPAGVYETGPGVSDDNWKSSKGGASATSITDTPLSVCLAVGMREFDKCAGYDCILQHCFVADVPIYEGEDMVAAYYCGNSASLSYTHYKPGGWIRACRGGAN